MAYYTNDHFYYSCVFGGTVYTWDGTLVPDPFKCKRNQKCPTMLLTQVGSNEKYFVRKIELDENRLSFYKELCLRFIESSKVVWCSDVIYMNDTQKNHCNNHLERNYDREYIIPITNDKGSHYAILIPYKDEYKQLQNAYEWFDEFERCKNFRNSEVLNFTLQLLQCLKAIDKKGYFYLDMDFARFYVSNKNEVYLDFSNLIFSKNGFDNLINTVEEKYYPLEFMKSSLVLSEDKIKKVGINEYMFSLASLIFYLLYHYYPYDGHIFDGLAHYLKFNYNDKIYHKRENLVFFNPPVEGLGIMNQDREITVLWDATSFNLKKAFIDALKTNNSTKFKSIDKWIELIEEFSELRKKVKSKTLRRDKIWKKI